MTSAAVILQAFLVPPFGGGRLTRAGRSYSIMAAVTGPPANRERGRTRTSLMNTMDANRRDVRWSPRVPKWKLRRLYQRTCQGIWDEELIDDVGMTLFARCQDILKIHRAQADKQVTCPRCERNGRETLIPRRGNRETPLRCGECGWSMTWRAYHRTFQRRQLNPGGAVSYFQSFATDYHRARDPVAKMLAIDRLIHEFHYSNRKHPDQPTRPAGVNLIVGDLEEVVRFLDELSGLDLPQDMRATEQEWRRKYQSTYWPGFLANRSDQPAPGQA